MKQTYTFYRTRGWQQKRNGNETETVIIVARNENANGTESIASSTVCTKCIISQDLQISLVLCSSQRGDHYLNITLEQF